MNNESNKLRILLNDYKLHELLRKAIHNTIGNNCIGVFRCKACNKSLNQKELTELYDVYGELCEECYNESLDDLEE